MTSQTIPNEVLALIFEELDCSKDRSMVSQSCKRFQEVVEPMLYGDVLQKSNESTSLLLRSILYNRPLAQLVKRFSIYQPEGTIRVLEPDQINAFHITHDWPNLQTWLEHCLKTTCHVTLERRHSASESVLCQQAVEAAEAWRFQCSDVDNWDALTAVLLTLLPNLERIDISRYDGSIEEISKVLSRASFLQCRKLDTEFSLLKLTEIRLGERFRGTDVKFFEMDHLIPALGFQSLKTLIAYGVTDDMLGHKLHFATQAQYLTLWHCGLAYNQLYLILINCVALKEVCIGHLSLQDIDSRFIPGLILEALEHSKDTLETLQLIDEDGRNHTIGYPSPVPRITHFPKLHAVEVIADLLLGQLFTVADSDSRPLVPNDVFQITDFPQSITLLVFREMRADLIQYLVLSDPDSQLPNLKAVHVEFISEEELKDNAEWLAVTAIYDKRNIAIAWSFCDGRDPVVEAAASSVSSENSDLAQLE